MALKLVSSNGVVIDDFETFEQSSFESEEWEEAPLFATVEEAKEEFLTPSPAPRPRLRIVR